MRALSVVLFGGSGFIGSHLAARLSDEGYSVVVPTRHESRAMHLMPLPAVDIVEADIRDDATLCRLVAGKDAVINLVGTLYSDRGQPYGRQFRQAHVDLPRRIAAACAIEGVPRYLHMSALGADPHGPSMFQRSKGDGEQAARSQPDVATTIFRPSVVFGPEDHLLTLFARLQRHLAIVPLARAHARFQPIHVGDVAEAFVHVLRDAHLRPAIYELGGPRIYQLAELVRLAGLYAGRERRIVPLPDAVARFEAGLFELLPGTPLITRDHLDTMKVDNVVSASTKTLTAAALGIKLTPLEAVAPAYLARQASIDTQRARAGR